MACHERRKLRLNMRMTLLKKSGSNPSRDHRAASADRDRPPRHATTARHATTTRPPDKTTGPLDPAKARRRPTQGPGVSRKKRAIPLSDDGSSEKRGLDTLRYDIMQANCHCHLATQTQTSLFFGYRSSKLNLWPRRLPSFKLCSFRYFNRFCEQSIYCASILAADAAFVSYE